MPKVVAFNTPPTTLTPVLSGTSFTAPFNVTAVFAPDTVGGSCAALVYRQYIFGTFAINSVVVPHYLCQTSGVLMSPSTPLEDGCPPNGTNCTGTTAYGYRQCAMTNDGYFNPDQATGAEFWMYDAPGFTNVQPGTVYALNLNFRGEIQNAGATLTQASWEATGQVATSATVQPATLETTTCDHDETPIGLRVARSHEQGLLAILSVSRRAGAPRLNSEAIQLRLWDAHCHEIETGPGVVHEVGNSRKVTAHLFYQLSAGSHPIKGSLALDGRPWGELPVEHH